MVYKMSDIKYTFHENDSDFITTHWILLIIGAITIYVGRKYFSAKGIGISHAVSRRRRILRDPLSRRPPPIITHVRQNNQFSSRSGGIDHAKKTNSEEELGPAMPGGSRRISRNSRVQNAPSAAIPTPVISTSPSGDINNKYSPINNTGTGTNNGNNSGYTAPSLELPAAPKHFPFPNIPMESELEFEIIMFIFITAAAALQFLQIYRSVWWLPHAYTNQAVNFYLIDINLVIFIMVLLSRRLIYMLGCLVLQRFAPAKIQPYVFEFYRIFLLIAIFSELLFCGYKIIQNHSLVNIFYLCYPISVYLILFGLTISPFFELIGWSDAPGINGRPLHSCSSNATAIRGEVDHLKTDFNNRMKQVLFSSVLNAYYAGFVPCCFAQSYVYYDVYSCTMHLIFVGVGCFTMYASHILPMRYCDVLHRSALHLGAWTRVEPRSHVPVAYNWIGEQLWPSGSLVRHSRELYRAQGTLNAAEPGNPTHARFHSIFKNPSIAASGLVGLQLSLVVIQLALLVRSSQWQQIVSLTLLLFVNYYTLFKIGRDYLVSLKLYRAEQTIHEKYTFH